MGTPDFAVFSLDALMKSGYNIIGVVTQTDKPVGRGYKMTPPPIKVYAENHSIPVYQPSTLKGDSFAELLNTLSPDMIVVTAYGKILPENVINYPKFGCINVHGSLLPKYRGAAPIQRAIINGEHETGITVMYMDKGLDTGDMLESVKVEIKQNDNFETIHDKLGISGAKLLCKVIADIEAGRAVRTIQSNNGTTYASKITKDDCIIDFSKNAVEIHNQIRGLSPVPLAFTYTQNGKLLKITSAKISDMDNTKAAAGTVISLNGGIEIACGKGSVTALGVLPEGKGKMTALDYIRGNKISIGDVLGNKQ